MKSRQVYTLGETVLDIIFRDDCPVAAKPGGAMLNTAVSLGRAGVSVSFISDFGRDEPGRIISEFLEQNGVSTRFVNRYDDGKTALALAFLDQNQDANYVFYKIFPEDRLLAEFPQTSPGDILLFGSFYAITPEIRERIRAFVQRVRESGALIIYDPNFRKPHLPELNLVRPWIIENISMSDIVRGSNEDFAMIFGAGDAGSAYRFIQDAGCRIMICTKNKEGVEIMTGDENFGINVPQIKPVSTIGAGDAFNAGIIWSLLSKGLTRENLNGVDKKTWREILETGIKFSTEVCMQFDNYIPSGFQTGP